jgi:hypothetical protein
MATTFEEVESANEKMLERLDAKTLDEFWLGKQEEEDESKPLEPRDGVESRDSVRVHLHGDQSEDREEVHREETVPSTPEGKGTR